uniref:telomere-associated protein RIF1 n=1 Tax=Doryrhamphus excisus TaxID=161450 RepID=UPI0025AEC9A0|nr:telomere-associated protein RIF1 [Doryrhamphus excisus]
MMASAEPPSGFSMAPLLECLEDSAAGRPEQTDAYLTIANRLSGEEGRQFLPAVEKHFTRLGAAILTHISSPHAELNQAALQALGFCLYHSHVVSRVSETLAADLLSALCSVASKSTEKNTCTRALWVISKQSFSAAVVGKKVPSILGTLESIWSKDDVLSVVLEHEALNVIIKLLDQVPAQMSEDTVRWAKLIIPLVVHSASKVRLRAAAAMETGLPLLLQKQTDVAAVIEPLMSTKLIPELQKLFMAKNETNVLKLWPLFVKLLGKMLHRGGPFINSLLHLEELGFRSSSPTVKKIAFIAWKSLIDNFALNPDILCSAKRMKLLMQPLMSINVRTEALMLTKVEVWWYLVVQLGPHLSPHFDQVSVPLLQYTFGSDSSSQQGTPARGGPQNGVGVGKTAPPPSFNSPAPAPRLSLNSSIQPPSTFPSIQLLGLEMLLHYFLGPEVVASATKSKLVLTLEPLRHPLLAATSSFGKHAAVLIAGIKDGFSGAGKDAPGSLLALLWNHLIHFVSLTIESATKKDRQGCEVLTLMLQALQSIVHSEALPAEKVLVLFEGTVKGISARVLGSASYQVGKMDVLNGTPALFLILLLLDSSMLAAYMEDARFHQCLKRLVGCGLSGPTSPLAFGEAVLGAIGRSAASVPNKEHLLRMWSAMVGPLTDTITQSNEVNQGDALEHNFSAMHSALLFPVTHLLSEPPLQLAAQKSMLSTWSKLYKVFARCSSLVVTAEENVCCEELCVKMAATVDREALKLPSTLMAVSCILQVMVECVDFSPYTPHFQQKLKSPHTPGTWTKKRSKALGNLAAFESLLVQCLDVYLAGDDEVWSEAASTGTALLSVLSALFTNLVLADAVKEALASLIQPLAVLYQKPHDLTSAMLAKMEKLVGEVLGCIQSRSALAYDGDLLALLSPLLCVLFTHKNKQHRTAVTHFWNATFANAVSLTYPDQLRPVLNQVKQKTPIILPGFKSISIPDELSGQYSSESSQLETKLSGVPVASVGMRDSQLGKTAEGNDRSSTRASKPVSMKLDFGSPKVPRREVLEEEASVDFVFIPPETKERVLTEHQKEVKRTKRVDIPAMYNNLDASLDTSVFSQYTQSQEDSMGKAPTDQAAAVGQDAPEKGADSGEVADVQEDETPDGACPEALEKEPETEEPEAIPESPDVSVEEHAKCDVGDEDTSTQSEKPTSPSMSVSGTPQKSSSSSRRQTFITLEKYAEGKPASPSTVSTFIGPLSKTSSSQEPSKDSDGPCPEDSQKDRPQNSENVCEETSGSRIQDSPGRPNVDDEPVRLTRGPRGDEPEDEDVIPDTQTEDVVMEDPAETFTSADMTHSDPNMDSQETLGDSQSSEVPTSPGDPNMDSQESLSDLQSSVVLTSPGDPNMDSQESLSDSQPQRRTSRKRSKHPIPEDVPVQSPAASNRPNTRNQKAIEEDTGRLRRRSLRESSESSQRNSQGRSHRKVKLYSNSGEFLTERENKRKSGRFRESSQTDRLSDSQPESSPSRQKRSRHRKSATEPKEESEVKAESSQADFLSDTQSESESQSQQRRRRSSKSLSASKRAKSERVSSQSSVQSDTHTACDSQEENGPPPKSSLEPKEEGPDTQSDSERRSEQSQDEASEALQTMENKVLETKSEFDDFQKDTQIVLPRRVGQSQEYDLLQRKTSTEKPSQIASSTDFSQNSQGMVPTSSETPPLKTRRRSRQASLEEGAHQSELGKITIASSQENVPSEPRSEGRKRRSKSSCPVTPESSQSSEAAASVESSQGRGRYSRRLSVNTESSESELSEARESLSSPKRRRKPRRISTSDSTRQSPAEVDSKDSGSAETLETAKVQDGDLSQSPDSAVSESLETLENSKEGQRDLAEAPESLVQQKPKPETARNRSPLSVSPRRKRGRPRYSRTKPDSASLESSEMLVSEEVATEMLVSEGVATERSQEDSPREMFATDTPALPSEQQEIMDQEVQPAKDSDCGHLGDAFVPVVEEPHGSTLDQEGGSNVVDDLSSAGEPDASNVEEEFPKQVLEVGTEKDDCDKGGVMPSEETRTTGTDPDAAPSHLGNSESTHGDVHHHSPAKLKDLEAALVQDMVHSPCSSRTRGTWSPSASPSSSILKKGQKRQLEEESPSPLVKSRRVSFANPIQQQETADDIDRRSPAVRSSSPGRSKVGNLAHPKFITTPTKSSLVLSPRNLRSPSFKSSKKCLISEMSPVSNDCIYPALVGCSAPVEAVLPQISSSMWSRGFGQLVRARNIKTVGDLSALTPNEIKTLPIRSPKISNVKKALKTYEEQRKGRGVDELKSFAETEMMTSELEEARPIPDQDDEKSGETLATALLDQPGPHPTRLDEDQTAAPDPPPEGAPPGVLYQLDTVEGVLSPFLLKQCSPQQLLDIHQRLTGMTSRVVTEMSTRLGAAHPRP